MTTIGYGDIVPMTHSDRLGIIALLVVNAGVFAYSVTTICDLALSLNINQLFVSNRRDKARLTPNALWTCSPDSPSASTPVKYR